MSKRTKPTKGNPASLPKPIIEIAPIKPGYLDPASWDARCIRNIVAKWRKDTAPWIGKLPERMRQTMESAARSLDAYAGGYLPLPGIGHLVDTAYLLGVYSSGSFEADKVTAERSKGGRNRKGRTNPEARAHREEAVNFYHTQRRAGETSENAVKATAKRYNRSGRTVYNWLGAFGARP